jgi:hypothetical protein
MIKSFWLSFYVEMIIITDDVLGCTTSTKLICEEGGSRFINMGFLFV